MNKLKQYAGLLNEEAPKDHFLAYITPNERDMLVKAGGVKTPTPSGIFAYPPQDNYTSSYDSSSNQSGRTSSTSGAGGGSGYSGGNDNNNWSGDQEDDVATMETNMNVTTNNNPTGWSGDSGVDAYESNINDSLLGTPDYQGTIFTGGTYATDDNQASRTLSYGDDAATEDMGRPDITYYQPTGSLRGNYRSKTELDQIKYIQDSKLKSVKNKLQKAGFDIPDDANFNETKAFINDLSSDELANSYQDLKKSDGTPFYNQETIEKWEKAGYIPSGGSMELPGLTGAFLNKIDKPLTRDELWSDLDMATEVGKSGGGAMDWQERMKTFQPNRYATMTGQNYNPISKTFTMKDGGGSEQDAYDRVAKPYEIGGSTPPQESMVSNYFSNMGSNLGVSSAYMNTYNTAKANLAKSLNMTPNTQQYGYGNTFNDNYARSMTSANPFFDELTTQGLI